MEWYQQCYNQMVKIYPKSNYQANHSNQEPYAEDIMRTSKNTLKSSQKTIASSNISKFDPSIYPTNWHPQGQSADKRESVIQNEERKAEEQEQYIEFPQPGLLKKQSAQLYRFGQKQANNRNQLIKIRNKQDINKDKLVINKNEEDSIRVFNVKQQEKSHEISQDLLLCQICYEQVPASYFENLGCGHTFCWNCVCSLLQESSNTSRPLRCPNQNCKRLVKIQQLSLLQKLPQHRRKKLKKDSLFLSLSNKQTQFLCPNQNCDDGIIKITPNNYPFLKQVKCNKCLSPYCSQCLQPPHPQQKACKNWRDEFNVLQHLHNYCRCQKCLNIIEKSDGCMHMTCKCGYQFCFRCGNRWRKFHSCNPFRFHQYKRDVLEDDTNQPRCSDYARYVGLEIGKGFWTIFVVFYMLPFMICGFIFGVIGIVICILCAGISYGYYLVLLEDCMQKSICTILVHSIIFPLGMVKGVLKIGQAHYYKICQLSILTLRGADLLLPFNCIPFECLT